MKKILAFAGSNSSQSINKKLVTFAVTLSENINATILDLNDFELPIFGIDLEKAKGIPEKAVKFKKHILNCDGIVLSLAEHNGAYAAVFKNLFDWLSRMEGSAWEDRPMLLLGTSPGRRGASSVLEIASKRFQFNGGKVFDTYSLPSFLQNFDDNVGITDQKKLKELKVKIEKFVKSL